MTVHRGEVVGLAGLLGSGRSSTAKAIYGAQPIDTGSVTIGGQTGRSGLRARGHHGGHRAHPRGSQGRGHRARPVRARQHHARHPALACRASASWPAGPRTRIADELIERLHIKTSGRDQKVSELSGGNQQKVLLARMLAMAPRLLILDDPTRGIDVGAKAEIQALVSELARPGPVGRAHQLRPGRGRGGIATRWWSCVTGRSSARSQAGEVSAERVVELIAAAASAAASDEALEPAGLGAPADEDASR